MSKFEKDFNPSTIYSYANRDYSNGNLYYNLGFDFESFTEPSFFWEKNNIKYNNLLDTNNTEHEILTEQHYNKIYTTGNLKFIKTYETHN